MNEQRKQPARLRVKLLFALSSVALCLVVFLAAELAARLFTNVALMGNSRDLFSARLWGTSMGNTPNFTGTSFGVRVHIDGNGFRVAAPDEGSRPVDAGDALLILGDSVAFGPGVPQSETVAGRLQRRLTQTRVFNAAVIGHGTDDYRNVAERFLPDHPEVRRVIVVLCLNDITRRSAEQIDAALAAETPTRMGPVRWLNATLRSRSKFYLWLKNTLTDPPKRYWLADSAPYFDPGAHVEDSLEPLVQLATLLDAREIEFFVVVAPYEYQLRKPSGDERRPQQRIVEHLTGRGVETLDALPVFESAGASSRHYFLGGDPMHFSPAGHEVMTDIIARRLDQPPV